MNNHTNKQQKIIMKKTQIETFACIMLLLPFFRIQLITIMMEKSGGIWETINTLFNISQAIITVIEIVLYIVRKKTNPKREHLLFGFLLFEMIRLFASVINGSFDFLPVLSNFMNIGFILLLYRKGRQSKYILINSIEVLTGTLSIIGAVTSIIMPNGFFPSEVNLLWGLGDAIYFLGSKNSGVFYYITFLLTRFYNEIEKEGKYSNIDYILFALFIGSTISTNSINGTLCMLVIFLYFIISKYKLPVRRLMKPRYLAIAAILAGVIILGGFLPNFAILTSVGRDTTFTGRTLFWSLGFQGIKNHPLVGNGIEAAVYIGNIPLSNLHSTYINIAFRYGIPALIMFLLICIDMFHIASKITNEKKILLAIVLFIHCLHNITDAPYIFCMIISMYLIEIEWLSTQLKYARVRKRGKV